MIILPRCLLLCLVAVLSGAFVGPRHFNRISVVGNMATSSKDLKKDGQIKKPSRVATRLSKAAKEAAKKAAEDQSRQDASSEDDEDEFYLASITSLSDAIDEELLRPRDGFRPPRESSSMRNLLEHNDATKDSKDPKTIQELYNVAMVFSKPLSKDQVTIEYASRLTKLARTIKFENYHPSLICFCGSTGIQKDSLVEATSAGIIFFKQLCAANDISLDDTDFCIVQHVEGNELSWSPSTFHEIVNIFKQRNYLQNWLSSSETYESATDEYGMTREEPRKKIHMHWTMFSTEYHLCNLNDIHQRSPRQSPLNTMLQDFDHVIRDSRGIVKNTWCFRYSTYPYLYSPNDLTVFLGKCYLLAQGLQPLLINLRGLEKQASIHHANFHLLLWIASFFECSPNIFLTLTLVSDCYS